MPGGILDDNDYVDNIVKGSRGGPRGGSGGGPGGSYYGAPGFGGYGYAGNPGGYGATPTVRRFTVPGANGPIPVQSVPNSMQGKTGPGALNQTQAFGGFRGMTEGLARDIGRRNGTSPGTPAYSPAGELGEYQNQGDVRSLMNYLLSQYQQGGNFNPDGSPAIMGALQDDAARQSNQARGRAQLMADVSGLDPAAAAALRMRTDLASNTQGQQMMSQAMLQQLLSRQNFGDNAINSMWGHSAGWDMNDQRAALDRRGMDQQRGGGLGGFIGQIGGALLPMIPGMFGGGSGGGGGVGTGGTGGVSFGRGTRSPYQPMY